MNGVVTFFICLAVVILVVVFLLARRYKTNCKLENEFQQKFAKWVGVLGYYNTEDWIFVDENKKIIPELEGIKFQMKLHKNSTHPIFIPCKIGEFTYYDKDCQSCMLEPITDKNYTFTVEYISLINVALANSELGDLFLPIKEMWRHKVGDQVQMHCVITPWSYNGETSYLRYIDFEKVE